MTDQFRSHASEEAVGESRDDEAQEGRQADFHRQEAYQKDRQEEGKKRIHHEDISWGVYKKISPKLIFSVN